ncbi:hypothetical protein ONZ45_g353 [Pleurotus djamor]|nr:hypothetical protein ONZ45_g353 [Pleurotus djamor]
MSAIARFLDTSPSIEAVLQKIEDLREDIRILEGYRNARLLIVSRLPTEVLSIIFEYLAALESRQEYSRTHARWMRVTKVCRLWRSVAINTPRLWGTIYFDNKLELAELFLERSKSAPLHIKLNYYAPNLDVAALWFNNPSRLRTIELNFTSLKPSTWVPLFQTLKVPNLETLTLTTHYPVHFDFATEVDADWVPRLHVVKLSNCSFDLRTPLVSQVRSLIIEYPSNDIVSRPMLEVMLALRDMKHLESLELTHLLGFSEEIPGDLLIDLPRLRKLKLKSKNPRVVLMLWKFACANIRSIIAEASDVVQSSSLAKQIAGAFHSVLPTTQSSIRLQGKHYNSEISTTVLVESNVKTRSATARTKSPPRVSQLQLRVAADNRACLALVSAFEGPNLESLTLRTSTGADFDFAIETDADNVPLLRAVNLYNCSFDLGTPVVSQVRSLTVRHGGYGHVHSLPMLEVMLALRDMTQLESLELTEILEFSGEIPGDLLVELPRLQEIVLRTRDPRIVPMLGSFVCSNIQSIIADTTGTIESDVLMNEVVGAFHSFLPNTMSPTRLRVKCGESNHTMTFFAKNSVADSAAAPVKIPKALRLHLRVPTDFSVCLGLKSVFPDHAPKVLEVDLGPHRKPFFYDREGLIAFTRSLDSIEKLVTSSAHDLLVIMSDIPTKTQLSKARGTTIPFSLPSLKHIDVTQYKPSGSRDRTYSNLQKALERRRNVKAGIEVLRINSSSPRSETENLKPEVQSLEYYHSK